MKGCLALASLERKHSHAKPPQHSSHESLPKRHRYLLSKLNNQTDCTAPSANPARPKLAPLNLPVQLERSMMQMQRQEREGGGMLEKVWLIRTIGDLLSEDNARLSIKRKKLKRSLHKEYKKLASVANQMMSTINEEGGAADLREARRLREALR